MERWAKMGYERQYHNSIKFEQVGKHSAHECYDCSRNFEHVFKRRVMK